MLADKGDARILTRSIARQWDTPDHSRRIEKGAIRMEEKEAARELARKATMKIGGDYVTDTPPLKFAETVHGRPVCWVPGEVLPRYAKWLRSELKMDVAVGDRAYYQFDSFGMAGRKPGRKKYTWWLGPGHDDLILATMTTQVG